MRGLLRRKQVESEIEQRDLIKELFYVLHLLLNKKNVAHACRLFIELFKDNMNIYKICVINVNRFDPFKWRKTRQQRVISYIPINI